VEGRINCATQQKTNTKHQHQTAAKHETHAHTWAVAAPTATALGALAGLVVHASAPAPLPEATKIATPAALAASTASLSAALRGPPSDMTARALVMRAATLWLTTHCRPAMRFE
jgi:hypothetical protein